MKKLFFLLYVIIQTSGYILAQSEKEDWDWQWGKSARVYTGFRNLGVKVDQNNDIYTHYWYTDSIKIGDTVFTHRGNYPNQQNFDLAIVKYDQNGSFIRAVDIYTTKVRLLAEMNIEPALSSKNIMRIKRVITALDCCV